MGQIEPSFRIFFITARIDHVGLRAVRGNRRVAACYVRSSTTDREDASSMVTAGATANTTEGKSRASRESGLCSHSHGESIATATSSSRRIYRGSFTEFPREGISALGPLPLWGNSKFYFRVRSLLKVNPNPPFDPIPDSTVCKDVAGVSWLRLAQSLRPSPPFTACSTAPPPSTRTSRRGMHQPSPTWVNPEPLTHVGFRGEP